MIPGRGIKISTVTFSQAATPAPPVWPASVPHRLQSGVNAWIPTVEMVVKQKFNHPRRPTGVVFRTRGNRLGHHGRGEDLGMPAAEPPDDPVRAVGGGFLGGRRGAKKVVPGDKEPEGGEAILEKWAETSEVEHAFGVGEADQVGVVDEAITIIVKEISVTRMERLAQAAVVDAVFGDVNILKAQKGKVFQAHGEIPLRMVPVGYDKIDFVEASDHVADVVVIDFHGCVAFSVQKPCNLDMASKKSTVQYAGLGNFVGRKTIHKQLNELKIPQHAAHSSTRHRRLHTR
ncbi:hypothetical protein HDU96_004688, partial [Phlyctochytrium bullatum]